MEEFLSPQTTSRLWRPTHVTWDLTLLAKEPECVCKTGYGVECLPDVTVRYTGPVRVCNLNPFVVC